MDALREEIAVAVAARRELGPDYEDAIMDAFAERLERTIETRGVGGHRADQRRLRFERGAVSDSPYCSNGCDYRG
jgi:hypothetical protein